MVLAAGTKMLMIIIICNPYKQIILSGKVGTKELDDKVRRLLRLAFHTTLNKTDLWAL